MYSKIVTTMTALSVVVGLAVLGSQAAFAQTITPNSSNGVLYSTGTTVSPSPASNGSYVPANNTTGTMNGTGGTGMYKNTSASGTPGVPNTGAGGDTAMNIALLLASGVIAAGGMTYLVRSFYVS